MNFFEQLILDVEKALGVGVYAPEAPSPTIRQVASLASSEDAATAVRATFTPPAVHDVPPFVRPVVVPPGEATLVSIIKAHRTSYDNPLKGVSIVAPTDEEAQQIADFLDAFSLDEQIPVEFLAAAMCQESLFAVNVRNGNFLGKNPGHTNEGTDWGVGQVNGANLPALFPDCKGEWPCLIEKITSLEYALPIFCKDYAGLLAWADGIAAHTDVSKEPAAYAAARDAIYAGGSAVDPKWVNPYWLAALGYNRGRTGALVEVAAGNVVAHPDHVATYCNAFCDVYGRSHLMPDAKGLNA